ncbi:MAG: molybdopterin-dependent oxidoreductase [Armatimonadetes bacterium]|nr:molybdopterin-dependent oxidoreductase [Armatimonadota bacterium]
MEPRILGKGVSKVDGVKLVTGRGGFTDDFAIPGMLYARTLPSPHAHARILRIDASKARALQGVRAVLTHEDVPRIPFTTAGQGYPEPSPYDSVLLDRKVRFVGDRVAAVAADTLAIAERALSLIDVEYEPLPALFDPEKAMEPDAPKVHDEKDTTGIHDRTRNLAASVEAQVGNVEQGFAAADLILERTYRVPHVQQVPLEPHICISYLDEDGRLVIRTSTQVPFHCRRTVARILGLPVGRIRIIKPRVGGGFGAKQEILLEDICGALTLAAKRPVRLAMTREEEFSRSRTRHPQVIRLKTGVTKEGKLTANEMTVVANTGAYGGHALTVQCCTGSKPLSLYKCPHVKYQAHAVYTNLAVAGAYRGYGCPQGYFAVESQMDELAQALQLDPIEIRKRNMVGLGDSLPMAEVLGEGKEGFHQKIESCGLSTCIEKGAHAIGWSEKRGKPGRGPILRGVGAACLMQGSAIPGVDMGSAYIKINDDGSFNLQVGATDLGGGSDTIFAQITAEVLGISPEQVVVYSSDTDLTPFDKGAYASSTIYITGGAVKKVAELIGEQIVKVASGLLSRNQSDLRFNDGSVVAPDGASVTLAQVAQHSFYTQDQFQIQATASHMSYACPPPFAAQFAEVEVDAGTGLVRVVKFVTAVDCGKVLNPPLAEGQIEGAVAQGLGYALTEELRFDEKGRIVNPNFTDYKIFTARDMPEMKTILVETHEPTGPFGAKSVAEIGINGPAPAVANAVFDALGIRFLELPITPEKILKALKERAPQEAIA